MSATARLARLTLAAAIAIAMLCVCAPSVLAAGAWWRVSARAAPTNLAPGKPGLITAYADDIGDRGVSGADNEITLTDLLPAGITVTEAAAVRAHRSAVQEDEAAHWQCTLSEADRRASCSTHWAIAAFEPLVLEIPVNVNLPEGTDAGLANSFEVSGGEAQGGGAIAALDHQQPLLVNDRTVSFGLEEGGYTIVPEAEGGALDSTAGSHPFQLTSTLEFNQTLVQVQGPHEEKVRNAPGAPALARNLSFQLPPGLLGNINATERCTALQFASQHIADNLCPAGSVVGVATVTLLEPSRLGYITFPVPLFNLVPEEGEPARFAFDASEVPVILDTSVRTGSDYGVTVSVNNATQAAQVLGAQITFWGAPGAAAHDSSRGWACLREEVENDTGKPCQPPATHSNVALLTLPTSCTGPLFTSMSGEAWTGATVGAQTPLQGSSGEALEGLEGCQNLPFAPSIETTPAEAQEGQGEGQPSQSASTPTGLSVNAKVDQQGTLSDGQLADSALKSATVTLPEGMLLSPSAANGLEACSEAQIGYEGPGGEDPLSPGAPQPLRFSTEKAACPPQSKLGSVRIKTPLLSEELTGSVYLAAQDQNPFGSLIALYISAENEKLGLRVKLAGVGKLNEATGQITTSFQDTPQVPFEELQLRLFGGPRGPLSTPATCGSYATTASFEPWSGSAPVNLSSPAFQISTGPGGGPCPSGPLPFAPSFQAGSSNQSAGAFTPFTLNIGHPDGNQPLSSLSMHLPGGIAAMLASVTPCGEPQAALNQCGQDSLIGHSIATAGLGPEPVTLPGQVYLTGPYEGAPFGISVVTPAVAGPFNLGDVTVRSQITVDPSTAAVSIQSDPFPTFVKGVPAQIKALSVSIDRPSFQFNPTNCDPKLITATITGAAGTSIPTQSPFQVQNCASLPFHPTLTASTKGNASKANGAAFTVKVTSSPGQANIAKTKLQLPIALPARLTTLQKACTDAVFQANPAACPEWSNIGSATVHTPVLKSPLTGPAYLVSHGNAAFPDVEFVLQGEGITLILDGQTEIKKGITTSTFNAIPDAPVASFETTLPEGPHSALTSNVPESKDFSLCGAKLSMPTTITAQNGAVITQQTKIPVLGCGAVAGVKFTRSQKLAKALKKCRREFRHSKKRRGACERKARRRYGVKKKAAKKSSPRGARGRG